jgi:hypothetical protein
LNSLRVDGPSIHSFASGETINLLDWQDEQQRIQQSPTEILYLDNDYFSKMISSAMDIEKTQIQVYPNPAGLEGT